MYDKDADEVPLNMYVVDLPHLHKYKPKYAKKFIVELSETDEVDMLSTPTVRAIIEGKWPMVKTAIKRNLLYPYICFLGLFLLYTVFIFEYMETHEIEQVAFDLSDPHFWIAN